jgi:type VI protein secretion system component Hcp
MIRTGLMEKIMSKTSHASNGALEDHGALEDTELDVVAGGKLIDAATPKLHEAACKGTHLPEVVIEVW